ncbi:MAG TPA: hypothetical protein EYP82_06515 [Hydrogenothermaceae bacterium]|nr:hypothetical protein [Hydrogenothermaceae bacterium]
MNLYNILDQFNKSAPITQSLCPFCIKNNNCTLDKQKTYCSKFELNPESTGFRISNKQFKIIEIGFSCCDNFNIKLAINTFKQLYPKQIEHELFYFVKGYNPLYFDRQRKREIEQQYSEIWTLFTACLSCSSGVPDGQWYIFVRV